MAGSFEYKPRVVDSELVQRLGSAGAVMIEGPKACGKTATARQISRSEVLLDVDSGALQAARVDPRLILDGETPRLIDEWQLVPEIWNQVRRAVDDRQQPGQFILAGSSAPADDATRHTGAMRVTRLRMRPMALFEIGTSTGAVSLRRLLDGRTPGACHADLSVNVIAELVSRGGWPALQALSIADACGAVRDYLEEIRRAEVSDVAGTRRDPDRVGRLLRSLARNTTTRAAITTLAADVQGTDNAVERHTIAEYLSALTRLFVIEDQPAWQPHLRSRYVLRKAPKRHFVDPSLAAAALRASPERLMKDLNMLGLLFESMVIRDLRVYAQRIDGQVLQYRDSADLEVDAIVETPDGRWGAFEVKLGGASYIDEAAAQLRTFADRVDTTKCGLPSCLGVLVGSGYAHVRPDGVVVVPIGCLGP